MRRRRFARALLCATTAGVAVLPTSAAAQQIDRIVAIGDSYADDGNLFQLAGSPPPSVYSTGRFSGGSNYIDTLSQILGVPVDNFAIGGALTNNTNTNSPFLPGFTFETASFLAGGGGVFPTVSGTFDEHDLLAVSVGGNDARTYQTGNAGLGILPGSLAGAPAAAIVAAGTATTNLNALVAAGAPTISFLAVNTALAPEVLGLADPASAGAIRNAFSTSFNGAIQQSLAGYANQGVIVHYLDLSLIGQRITADPGAFGLQNAGACPAAQATRCVTEAAFTNQFLFYVDGLHLTSAGFAIVAQYVATQLTAPLTIQAPSDLGLATARQFGRTLSGRADLYGPRSVEPGGMRLFILGDAFQSDVRESDDNIAFDMDGSGVSVGLEFGMPVGTVGVVGNISRPKVNFGNDASHDSGRSYQVGAYAALGGANAFVQGQVGYGKDKHRLTRMGVIDDMSARADGSHIFAGVKAGYLMPMSALRIGPIAALDYAKAKVDGYTESGDAALTLNVGKQRLKALTGQIGLEARADIDDSGIALRPYISGTIEKDFTGDGRLITFAQTSAPGIVDQWTVARSKKAYGRVSGGATAQLFGAVGLDVALSSTISRKAGQEFGGQLGVHVKF